MASGKRTSYFYAIFGITLVLSVLGVALSMMIEARKISMEYRENFKMELMLKDDVAADRVASLQSAIKGKPFVKTIQYISKEEALKILLQNDKDGYVDTSLLPYNPLYASFIITLNEPYATNQQIEKVKAELLATEGVQQVNFVKNFLESLDTLVNKLTPLTLLAAVLLLIFAISLIFNTIRLAMFSNQFTIKSMQLIGATRWFIIKPFLGRSIFNGFISGVVACIVLLGIMWYVDYSTPELGLKSDLFTFALLFGALILFGILISFFSTLTAIFRYLRVKVEDLY